jgi:hypothetical protein
MDATEFGHVGGFMTGTQFSVKQRLPLPDFGAV